MCVLAEAKDGLSVAHSKFKEAAMNYDRSGQKLKELLLGAPVEGFMAKADEISRDMQLRDAEVDLGMVVLKEVVASAVVMESYSEAIQENKDKLQK